jgi:hypothetical protein
VLGIDRDRELDPEPGEGGPERGGVGAEGKARGLDAGAGPGFELPFPPALTAFGARFVAPLAPAFDAPLRPDVRPRATRSSAARSRAAASSSGRIGLLR